MYRITISLSTSGTNLSQRLISSMLNNFVPKHTPALASDIKLIENFILDAKRLLILTGAGVSTESGIPDYRSDEVGLYARSNHKPIQHQQFITSPYVRKKYWARNYVAWSRFSSCEPNTTHESIKNLEIVHKKVSVVVTQNVDGLHFKAGSKNVIELHGSSYRVICLHCDNKYSRYELQNILKELNPNMNETTTMIRPDGDVELSEDHIHEFKPPLCEKCGGILKPEIVFFGDNIPKKRVREVENYVTSSDSLLVLGSSLSVFSAYRIILQAVEESKKIAIINIGPTRADKLEILRVAAKCGDILPKIY